jgi:hypothetical protein
MVDDRTGQVRLVVSDERNGVAPRYVIGTNNDNVVPRDTLAKSDLTNPTARERTPDCDAVEHARKGEIVDVLGAACYLGRRLFARNGRSYEAVLHSFTVHSQPG